MLSGLLNKQIASEMNLSEITVKVHRGQVMRKMNARSMPDLVRTAEALGIEPRLAHGGHRWPPSPEHFCSAWGDSLRASESDREPVENDRRLVWLLQQHECAVTHRLCL